VKVLITGSTGQDGHYLIEELAPVHRVYALYRGQEERRLASFQQKYPNVTWVRGDVTDAQSVHKVMREVEPGWVFNMAACSFVGLSWEMPDLYMQTNAVGVLNVLSAAQAYAPHARIVQASTSEMFGNAEGRLNEDTPMRPVSPYGVSKLAAHHLCRVYRESYGMHVSCAISFNHESPYRPESFVTRKITKHLATSDAPLRLGNTQVRRDWGFAGDYVKAYVKMAEQERPDDYVIATGESHSVQEFCEVAAEAAGRELAIIEDAALYRPNELYFLEGDSAKAQNVLGWEPSVSFHELVTMMVEHDKG
jgi:GDPmannose 4,6-dehydratase